MQCISTARAQKGTQVCSITEILSLFVHADLSPNLGNQPLVLRGIQQFYDQQRWKTTLSVSNSESLLQKRGDVRL